MNACRTSVWFPERSALRWFNPERLTCLRGETAMINSAKLEDLRNHCHAQAGKASRMAAQVPPELRENYLRLAQTWLELELEIDRLLENRGTASEQKNGSAKG